MTKLLVISISLSLLFIMIVPLQQTTQGQRGGGLFDLFCGAVRSGVAQGPQQNFCLFQALNNAVNNLALQQQQQCPTGTILQGISCIPINQGQFPTICPINSVLINGICQTQTTQLPPIANAGPAQTVPSRSIVTLDGTASFAQNGATIVSYVWNQPPGQSIGLNLANPARPVFTAPSVNSTTTTTVSFSLIVTDSNGLVSAPSSVTITVTPQL
jgi:K319-like protein